MSPADADRNLLFGMLALHMEFITREQMIAGLHTWVRDKTQPLGTLLCAQGALAHDQRDLLEALVQQHLAQHGQDAAKSLAAIGAEADLKNELAKFSDTDVLASLAAVPDSVAAEGDLYATVDPNAVTEADPTPVAAPHVPAASSLRFRILRAHARGGLGQVFVARDEELQREVALKEIQGRHADNAESRSRFLLEAEITGGLEHPGIVPVYGLGTYQDGRPYYAMRFIRGDSLKEAIERFHQADAAGMDPGQRSLELRALLGRFVDVCNAIAYAHSRGVLHRDLKPGNIMLGKYGETLVVDWGLAKPLGDTTPRTAASEPGEGSLTPSSLSGSSQTLDGTAVGTPQFMSPEQAAGRLDQLGPASDVYSLGATLYCLLTGQPSVQGPDLGAVLHKVAHGEIPPPRAVKKDVPIALDAVCRKAMKLEPSERYASPRLLADDIEHWLADEPVSAWVEPWTVKARRWLGRHRLLVSSVASAVGVALIGLTVATILLTAANEREFQARKKAEHNFQLARQAVDRYHTEVSESVLLHEPGMETLRKKLLEAAREFYEQFVQEHVNDPAVQGELGRAIFRLAQISADVDSERKAIPLQEQAIAIFAKLPAAGYQGDLAGCYHHLGRLYRLTDQPVPSEAAYRKALPLWEELVKEQPGMERYQAGLARTQMGLGNVYQVTRRWDEAQKIDRQALATRVALTQAHPANAEYQRDLAVNYSDLAMIHHAEGKDVLAAEKAFRQALKVQKQLVDDYPTVSQYKNDLARTHFNLGDLEAQAGQHDRAEASYQEAAKLWQALTERHPAVLVFTTLRAEATSALAAAYLKARDVAKAEDAAKQAVALQRTLADQHKDSPAYQADLGRGTLSLAEVYRAGQQLGKAETAYREAVRLLEPVARDLPRAPHYRSALARSYHGLGLLYALKQQEPKTRAAFKQAQATWEQLVTDYPHDPEFALGLSALCFELGTQARKDKNLPDALAWYGRAVTSVQRQPLQGPVREALGHALWMRADTLTKLERYAEALIDWDEALVQVRPAQKPALQLPRMLVLARLGKYMEATAEAGALAPQARSGDALYRFATVYALASASAAADGQRSADERLGIAEQFAERALQLLTTAQGAGYFKMEANRTKLTSDPDLVALRDRPDFLQWKSAVEAK